MGKKKKGLGKGLNAILPEDIEFEGTSVVELSVDEIYPSPEQPRKVIDEDSVKELADSIKQHGIISPIIVRRVNSRYEIVAGERRYRAALLAGLKKIPSVVKEIPDDIAFKISLVENIQREDLNPMDEAEGYYILSRKFKLTHKEIANALSKDRSTITNALRLMSLPEEARDALRKGLISTGHARAILAIDKYEDQVSLLKKIIYKKMSVRQTESLVSKKKGEKIKKRKDVDKELEILSGQLSEKLSTKVVCTWGRRKGRIIIDIASRDQLNTVVQYIMSAGKSPI